MKEEVIKRTAQKVFRVMNYSDILAGANHVLPKAEAINIENAIRPGLIDCLASEDEFKYMTKHPRKISYLWKSYQRIFYGGDLISEEIAGPLARFSAKVLGTLAMEKQAPESSDEEEEDQDNDTTATSTSTSTSTSTAMTPGNILSRLAQVFKKIAPRTEQFSVVLEAVAKKAMEAPDQLSCGQFCELLEAFIRHRWVPGDAVFPKLSAHLRSIVAHANISELTTMFRFYAQPKVVGAEAQLPPLEARLLEIASDDLTLDLMPIFQCYAKLAASLPNALQDIVAHSIEQRIEDLPAGQLDQLVWSLHRTELRLAPQALAAVRAKVKQVLMDSRIRNLAAVLEWYIISGEALEIDESDVQLIDSRVSQTLQGQDVREVSQVLHALASSAGKAKWLSLGDDHAQPALVQSQQVLEAALVAVSPKLNPKQALSVFRSCASLDLVLSPRVVTVLADGFKPWLPSTPIGVLVKVFTAFPSICGQPESLPPKAKSVWNSIIPVFLRNLDNLRDGQVGKIVQSMTALNHPIPEEMRHMSRARVVNSN